LLSEIPHGFGCVHDHSSVKDDNAYQCIS